MTLERIKQLVVGRVPREDLMRGISIFLREDHPMEEKKEVLGYWDRALGLEPANITDEDVEFHIREVLGVGRLPAHLFLGLLYRQGLDALRGTMVSFGEEMEVPISTLRSRRSGVRPVDPAAARDLASFLKTRARHMERLAGHLEQAAGKGDGHDD